MANKSALIRVMGDTPYVRVLDFLLAEGRILDYTLSDISRRSNVAWVTLHSIWPKIEELGIVTKTREVGRAKMYKLNEESPIARILVKTDFLISKSFADMKNGKNANLNKELEDFDKAAI
ncbi:MAG: hypothetical protein J4431_00295 [Candidatus Aenigmarchaeota archaeon]|nr:hypothetical protein [Candidatus Aenigmarchaeota archaeon]